LIKQALMLRKGRILVVMHNGAVKEASMGNESIDFFGGKNSRVLVTSVEGNKKDVQLKNATLGN